MKPLGREEIFKEIFKIQSLLSLTSFLYLTLISVCSQTGDQEITRIQKVLQ